MLHNELFEAIREIPVVDIHSHLPPQRFGSDSLADVLFYHMMLYAYRSAGMKLDPWPDHRRGEGDVSFDQLPKVWPAVAHTGFGWALRTMLRELYDFNEPITAESLSALQEAYDARHAQAGWGETVAQQANILRILSSRDPRPDAGECSSIIRPTIEKINPVTFMEGWLWPAGWKRRAAHMGVADIHTPDDLRESIRQVIDHLDWTGRSTFVVWFSSLTDFRPIPESQVDSLLTHAMAADSLTPQEVELLNAAGVRMMIDAAGKHATHMQLCFGCQTISRDEQPHPVMRSGPYFASSLGNLFGEFPQLHFNLLNGDQREEPILAAHPQAYDNVSLGGYWWHMFYPSVMHEAWQRRLDMVPLNKLCGFFSDGYCIEWIYARLRMTQNVLAGVLAERIERGYCNRDEALHIARSILLETPREIFLPGEEL